MTLSCTSLLPFSTIFASIAAASPKGCCDRKVVGGVSYTFKEEGKTDMFSCLSDCIYARDDLPESKFCFARGYLEVICSSFSNDTQESVGENGVEKSRAQTDWAYCTSSKPCDEGRGDCDYDRDCKMGLICGENNCKDFDSQAHPYADCCVPGDYYYNIAHMTNTPKAVRWALDGGANGVEIDLQFEPSGAPTEFKHSRGLEPCDCTCTTVTDSVCGQYPAGSRCTSSSSMTEMVTVLADSSLAMVIIDSKLGRVDDETKYTKASQEVVRQFVIPLFEAGYGGKMMVGAAYIKELSYLKGALAEIRANKRSKKYEDRILFTIDGEGGDIGGTLDALHKLNTQQIAYGTGISACGIFSSKSTTYSLTKYFKNQQRFSLPYIWTVDKESSIAEALGIFRGVISNYPRRVKNILASKGRILATPLSSLPKATNKEAIGECDCDYVAGGCKLTKAPGKGVACKCQYKGGWTCGGEITTCTSTSDEHCKNPTPNYLTCKQGRGDCGGYTCDCDYKWRWPSGGCRISATPDAGYACKCKYVGGWTCQGESVDCRNALDTSCTQPGKDKKTCKYGGGDCKGY